MQLNISQLKKSTGLTAELQAEEHIASLDLAGEMVKLLSPVKVTVTASNTGDLLLVKGSLATELEFPCSRCLNPFVYPVQTAFQEEYSLAGRQAHCPDNEKVPKYIGEKDYLDLSDTIIESLLLSIPMKPVCQPDCLGLCPYCGGNRNDTPCGCREENIDPRLAVLKKISFKESGEKGV